MNMVRHILAKDVRRLRWLLVAWLAVVVSRVAVTAARSDLAFEDFGLQIVVDDVSGLLLFVDVPMLVLLVSWLVHDEPLIGADAFWLTRPIRPGTLMGAKLVFAGLFLIGAPVIAQSIAVASVMRSPGHSIRLMPGLLVSQLLWVAGLVAIATLTASLTRFLLAIVAGVATLAVALTALTTSILMTAEVTSYPAPMLADRTTAIVGSWLFVGVALVVIGLQYRTRRRRLACSIGVAGLIGSALLAEAWPWRFARSVEPDPGAWARDTARVAAVLDAGAPYVTDEMLFRQRATPKKQIAAPIRLSGVPPQYVNQSIGVRSRLEFPDGSAVESAQGDTVTVRREGGDQSVSDYTAPLQAVLQQTRILRLPDDPRFGQWPVVLTVSGDEYERYGHTPGRLTATVESFLQESRLVASIPLMEGAIVQAPSHQLELRRVLRRLDGCSVLIREMASAGGRPDVPRSYRYLLRNTQRGEAVLGDNQPIMSGGLPFRNLPFGGWSFEAPLASGFGVVDHVERYPAQSLFGAAGQIDADWLARADLAVIETAYAGRVSRSLVVDGFRMQR
jgi:hypothetical protein